MSEFLHATRPTISTLRTNLLSQSICVKETTQCVLILQIDVHQACTVTTLLAGNHAQSLVIVGQDNARVCILMDLHGLLLVLYTVLKHLHNVETRFTVPRRF